MTSQSLVSGFYNFRYSVENISFPSIAHKGGLCPPYITVAKEMFTWDNWEDWREGAINHSTIVSVGLETFAAGGW